MGSFRMPDTGLLFSIALAVLSSHHVLGCPGFTSCQTRMATALGAPGADTVSLCRALRDYLECTRGASASCGVSERGYVVEAFNVVNVRYLTLCSAVRTTRASPTVDSTTPNAATPSSATSSVSSATTPTSAAGETSPEADLLPKNSSATLTPVPSYLPEVTSDYTSPKDQVTTTSESTEQMLIAAKKNGSACTDLPKQSSVQLCTVRQIMSQFNSGCTQLDHCAQKVSESLNIPDDVLICGSLDSYKTCALKAKHECGDVDNSNVQKVVSTMYTLKNCTAVLKEITTSVQMSPVTDRYSVSAPTRGFPGTFETSTQPESSSSATDTSSYILSSGRFKVTNAQNTDVTSTHLKDTSTPTMSFESTSRLEVTTTQNTDGTTLQLLKGTGTTPVTSVFTSRVKDTDSQITERSSVAPVSSTDRHTHISSVFYRETTTEVKTNVHQLDQVTSSSTRYSSSSSQPAVVRRERSSTLRVTEVPLSHTDDTTVPTLGVDMTTAKNKTPFKTNIWTSLVTNTRTSRVTSPSILPGQPTDATSGFHQSTKSTDHTEYGTRSSTEMKKTRPPGEFPTILPPEEEESTKDTSNSQGRGVTSSGTNRCLSVSTMSTVLVIWVCWKLYITTT